MKRNFTHFKIALLLIGVGSVAPDKITAQCNPPTPATASPSVYCAPGGTSNLNAVSVGNQIRWYTVPTGGSPIGTTASGVNFMVTTAVTTTYYAESFAIATGTYNYTGGIQTYTVPGGATTLTVDLYGAKGGTGWQAISVGGNGGRVQGTIAVTPGQVLNVYVGGIGGNAGAGVPGTAGYNGGGVGASYPGNYGGGGGGGASDIRIPPYGLADRIAVAGGGGGGAFNYGTPNYDRGGAGGGLNGEGGYSGNILLGNGPSPGGGGTQFAGGATGTWPGYCTSLPGTLGTGGMGAPCGNSGGGGGGGYYGGGGGCWGGGGGGSNYLPNGTHSQGVQNGAGQVIITGNGCVSASRTPVIVTVIPNPVVTITGSTQICSGNSTVLQANGATTYTWNTGSLSSAINVAPPSTTTYSVIGMQGACSGTAAVTVTVNPIPNVNIVGNNTVCAGSPINLLAGGATTYTWNTGDLTANIAPSPTSNVTYTVLGMNPTGCYSTAVKSVTVSAIPTITLTGPNAMCVNQTITLNGFGATTYSWSNGFMTQSVAISQPVGTNVYTLVGYSALGCASMPLTKTITTNPLPTVLITSTETLICKGMTATLSAEGANTYSWSTGALTSTIAVSPSVTTSYTTTGTNTTTGCYTTAIMTVYVSPCTGLEAIGASSESMSIYPNPNNGEFVVELKNGREKTIRVFDLVGRQVVNMSSTDDKITVNINDLANGIYYVRVQSASFAEVIKVVKQ